MQAIKKALERKVNNIATRIEVLAINARSLQESLAYRRNWQPRGTVSNLAAYQDRYPGFLFTHRMTHAVETRTLSTR